MHPILHVPPSRNVLLRSFEYNMKTVIASTDDDRENNAFRSRSRLTRHFFFFFIFVTCAGPRVSRDFSSLFLLPRLSDDFSRVPSRTSRRLLFVFR